MKKPVEDWLFYAENDLKTAKILIKEDNPLTSIIAFHCQQAIEKYFKAYILNNNLPLIKTHDLIKLNDMIKEIKDLGIDETKLIVIKQVYSESRYPGDLGLLPDVLPTDKQAREYIEFSKEIRTIILKELSHPDTGTP